MTAVIGHILPLALAVALSSIPIIAVILILLSPTPPAIGISFLVGCAAGVFLVVAALSIGFRFVPQPTATHPPLWQGIVEIVAGAALTVYAAASWYRSSKRVTEPSLPKWMAALNHLNPFSSLGVGFALAFRPKNLLLSIAAGVEIGSAGLGVAESLIPLGIFTVVGVCTVAGPVIGYVILGKKIEATLQATREWIVRNNQGITSVVLILSGVVILGAGLARV
ncbi:GAP family protein [soil metagenome]